MIQALQRFEAATLRRLWPRPIETGLARNTVRSLVIAAAGYILAALLPDGVDTFFRVISFLALVVFVVCLLGLVVRWVSRRVLWTVRSRLIVTCLLLGVAPIVLFLTLGGIAGYTFWGQFATIVANERIDDDLKRMRDQSAAVLAAESSGALPQASLPGLEESGEPTLIVHWLDGWPLALAPTSESPAPFAQQPKPAWLKPGFRGVVADLGQLFLCADSGVTLDGHSRDALACLRLRNQEVAALGEGLGSIKISRDLKIGVATSKDDESPATVTLEPAPRILDPGPGARHRSAKPDSYSPLHHSGPAVRANLPNPPADAARLTKQMTWVEGGKLAAPLSAFDIRVFFSAPLPMFDWVTGDDIPTWLVVVSRPSVLYDRLFSNSVQTGTAVRIALVAIGMTFILIELLACLMALALSRTITGSIANLYEATRQIDQGNLDYHIPVRRRDQLAALAGSFNTMTASLKGLLAEQLEKDRMQTELKIAQEVQNNLFPHLDLNLPNFELYGICEPARVIGGDYYDFIPFGPSQVYLALGDISGKGISAALLMASLHSAVRAFQREELPPAEYNLSPATLLALLNRHLFTSTQPAKYATLFVASYDNSTRQLTYANGGHPAPILLSADGRIRRLDCGGSVVGLLEQMHYDEATIQLEPGDLLIAYSDGLTEPERGLVEFGEERLVEAVRRNQILPLAEIASGVLEAVRQWFGEAEQPDDMTLVLARLD